MGIVWSWCLYIWQFGVRVQAFVALCRSVPGLALRFAGRLRTSLVGRILHVRCGNWYDRSRWLQLLVSVDVHRSGGRISRNRLRDGRFGCRWAFAASLDISPFVVVCRVCVSQSGWRMGGGMDDPLTCMGGGAAFTLLREGRRDVAACSRRL